MSTEGRVKNRLGFSRLKKHEAKADRRKRPVGAARRQDPYQHKTAGPIRAGWLPDQWRSRAIACRGVSYEMVHVVIENAKRLA